MYMPVCFLCLSLMLFWIIIRVLAVHSNYSYNSIRGILIILCIVVLFLYCSCIIIIIIIHVQYIHHVTITN